MRSPIVTMLSTSTLALAAAIALAQGQGGPPPNRGEAAARPRPLIDTTLDVNGDEIIDAGEIANAPTSLKKLDSDGDGLISLKECVPPRPGGQSEPARHGGPLGQTAAGSAGVASDGRPRPPIFAVLDVNGDGILDASEIANAAAMLKKLDKNGDGQLAPDEYRPPRPRGHADDPSLGGAPGPR